MIGMLRFLCMGALQPAASIAAQTSSSSSSPIARHYRFDFLHSFIEYTPL